MSSLLQRFVDFGRSDDEITAGELRQASTAQGCRPITTDTDRQVVTFAGTVASVTLRPRAQVPALIVQVFDGSTTVQLIWMGRRRIIGIDPGTYLKVKGLLCRPGGVPTIYNPAYELASRHDG